MRRKRESAPHKSNREANDATNGRYSQNHKTAVTLVEKGWTARKAFDKKPRPLKNVANIGNTNSGCARQPPP